MTGQFKVKCASLAWSSGDPYGASMHLDYRPSNCKAEAQSLGLPVTVAMTRVPLVEFLKNEARFSWINAWTFIADENTHNSLGWRSPNEDRAPFWAVPGSI